MSPDCFAVGDVVRIREWDDMESEFGLNARRDIKCACVFVTVMRESCGELCTVLAKDGKYVGLAFEDPRIDDKMHGWQFSTDMIEPAGNIGMSPEVVRSVSDFLSEM